MEQFGFLYVSSYQQGWAQKAKGDQRGESGVLWSSDKLGYVTDGREGHWKEDRALKKFHTVVPRTRKAGRPSAAPAVTGLSIACALLGVECLQPQPRPVLLKTFSFPSIIPRSSLLADSQAKTDIFTARRKLYVSTTILEGRERESPYSVTTTNHSDLLKMTKWEANCPKEKDSWPLPPHPAARGALTKMKKVCLRIGNIRIHIFKKRRGGRKEKKIQLISPSRLKEKPDLEWNG